MNRRLLLIFSCTIFFFSGCDKVEHPVIELGIDYDEEKYGPAPAFEPATADQQVKRVFVEDFTAHQCGNCPAAAIVAEDLAESHPGRVVVMAIHAGSLAETDDDYYDTDWTCEESIVFWNQLDFQANPLGRVDRSPNWGNILSPAQWEENVTERLATESQVALQMVTQYVPDEGDLNIHIQTEFLENLTGTYKLAILITESHLVDNQLDYDADEEEYPGGLVFDYEFNHVLRGSVTGALGLGVGSDPEAGFRRVDSYTYSWNNDWDSENCHVIAVVYDSVTGIVLNVIENHLDA